MEGMLRQLGCRAGLQMCSRQAKALQNEATLDAGLTAFLPDRVSARAKGGSRSTLCPAGSSHAAVRNRPLAAE